MEEKYIYSKDFFGRDYRFVQIDPSEDVDVGYLNKNQVDSISIALDDKEDKCIKNLSRLTGISEFRGGGLNNYCYETLQELSNFSKVEYLDLKGKSLKPIPFEMLKSLWCVYLNYDKKTCQSIFECENLEYIFIDNYSDSTSINFTKFKKAKRIGLIKSKITEFDAIKKLTKLEHIGIGYNLKLETLEWMKDNNTLKSVAFQNCKNIKDWNVIASSNNIEKIYIENCGELQSISLFKQLTNLKEIRILGNTSIKDGKVKELMSLPKLKYLFVPVKKEYDISLQDLTCFNS